MRLKPTGNAPARTDSANAQDSRPMAHPWFHLNRAARHSASSLDLAAAAKFSQKS